MEFLNYPPMQLTTIGIMTAMHVGAAMRLCITAGPRGAFRYFLGLVIIYGTSILSFGIGAHRWPLIVGGWSAVILAWIICESLNFRHKQKRSES